MFPSLEQLLSVMRSLLCGVKDGIVKGTTDLRGKA